MVLDQDRVKFYRDMWNNLRVPVRPGPEGLDLYRSCMNSVPEKNFLILGATPELVDMAVEIGASRIVSIERYPEVMEAMRQLGKYEWSSVESIIGDWLYEHPDYIASFDCIVCDGGLLFLDHPAQWRTLFSRVHNYLVPGGIFVAKELAEPPGNRDYEQLKEKLTRQFEEDSTAVDHDVKMELYKLLVSELRVATLMDNTDNDGKFIQTDNVKRLDTLIDEFEKKFPESEMVQITLGAFKYLARSQPGTTDVITGVRYEGTKELLAELGFESEYYPLPDRPVPDANYMFVAQKK
jgi:SAM-dependent methyltransferase